jgi:hypothetical protein
VVHEVLPRVLGRRLGQRRVGGPAVPGVAGVRHVGVRQAQVVGAEAAELVRGVGARGRGGRLVCHVSERTRRAGGGRGPPTALRANAQWMYLTGWFVANAPERPKRDPGARLER